MDSYAATGIIIAIFGAALMLLFPIIIQGAVIIGRLDAILAALKKEDGE